MIKILSTVGLFLVVAVAGLAMHRAQIESRNRSLDAYNAIVAFHDQAAATSESAVNLELALHATVDKLHEGDAGYIHLQRMASMAETSFSKPEHSTGSFPSYDACNLLSRQDLDLKLNPQQRQQLGSIMVKVMCNR